MQIITFCCLLWPQASFLSALFFFLNLPETLSLCLSVAGEISGSNLADISESGEALGISSKKEFSETPMGERLFVLVWDCISWVAKPRAP